MAGKDFQIWTQSYIIITDTQVRQNLSNLAFFMKNRYFWCHAEGLLASFPKYHAYGDKDNTLNLF